MQVRLTRKLADSIDGVDVSRYRVGDVIELTRPEATLLIRERWAHPVWSEAGDAPKRQPRTAERLREIRKQLEDKSSGEQERRRIEDRIREELQDSRAKTYPQKHK